MRMVPIEECCEDAVEAVCTESVRALHTTSIPQEWKYAVTLSRDTDYAQEWRIWFAEWMCCDHDWLDKCNFSLWLWKT